MSQQEILKSKVIKTSIDTSTLGFSQIVKRLAKHVSEQELYSIEIYGDEIFLFNGDYEQQHKTWGCHGVSIVLYDSDFLTFDVRITYICPCCINSKLTEYLKLEIYTNADGIQNELALSIASKIINTVKKFEIK